MIKHRDRLRDARELPAWLRTITKNLYFDRTGLLAGPGISSPLLTSWVESPTG